MTTFKELLDMEITAGVRLEIANQVLEVRDNFVVRCGGHLTSNILDLFARCLTPFRRDRIGDLSVNRDLLGVADYYYGYASCLGPWPECARDDYTALKRLLIALAYGYENNGERLEMRDGQLVIPSDNPLYQIRALKRKVTV